SPCYLLTVRVIRARNIYRADVLSQTDCYVSLWLPTASTDKFQTKVIKNCKDPVWNETFYFRIQGQVKNMLELRVFDKDVVTEDDHLFTVYFDIAKLSLGEQVFMHFKCDAQVRSDITNEVAMALPPLLALFPSSGSLICSCLLQSRKVCCLEVQVIEKKKKKKRPKKSASKKEFLFKVKGSYEGTQDIRLGPDPVFSSAAPVTFHYAKYKQPTLDVTLPGKNTHSSAHSHSYDRKVSPNVELHSFPSGKEMTLAEVRPAVLWKRLRNPDPDHLDIRLGFDLCVEEQDFLRKRQKHVAAAVKKVLHLEQDLLDHETPVVAIMTTGGGMRSLTALYGSLLGLKKLHFLDCATYLTGLSGTTWTMSNLYRDADWSQKDLDKQISEARKHMTKCKINSLSMEHLKYYKKQLCQRKREGRKTSFIDLWGLVLESLLHDGKDGHKLSDQQRAVDRGQNPLPIYTAVNVKNSYSTLDFKEWVEFTPYEVGLLKYGAFVRSEDFGSEFFMGRLMKKLPESRICFLEGMWSSLFSLNVLYIWNLSHSSEDFWHRWTQDKIDNIEEEPFMPLKPHELRTRVFTPPGPLSSAIRDALTDRLSVAQEHNFLKGFQMHKDYLENKHFCRWKDTILDTIPNKLTESEEYLSLVDTGFFINTSIMPLLRPERKVDVILHLNYSAGSQIQALDQTCKYCSDQGILFPRVELSEEDRKKQKECYLFEGAETPGAPILLFFPLINDTFQNYKAPGQKRSESEMEDGKVDLYGCCSPYSTYSVRYTEKVYDRLVQLGEYNILNNEDLITQALHTAVERKRQKKK
ncbi:PA24E phospholipase, partial [Crypturellus soui]|nr:PA24E phospholipase [Crypturellus soui]